MGKKAIIAVTALALLGLGGGAYLELGGKAPAGAGEAAAEGEGSGPRGGMLLRQGDLTLELLVPEDGSSLIAGVELGFGRRRCCPGCGRTAAAASSVRFV